MCINVKLRLVRVTTIAAKKQYELHILSVCLEPELPSMQSACAVLYCDLWPYQLYRDFSQYLINDTTFGKVTEYEMRILICCTSPSETFLILRRTERHMITNVHVSVCMYKQQVEFSLSSLL